MRESDGEQKKKEKRGVVTFRSKNERLLVNSYEAVTGRHGTKAVFRLGM